MRDRVGPVPRLPLLVAIVLAMAAGATAPALAQRAQPLKATPIKPNDVGFEDPFEKLNRHFFATHQVLDKVVLRPVSMIYKAVIPKPIRAALHNLVIETSLPLTFANDVVQFRPKAAGKTAGRFLVNAVVGVGGLLDPATGMGLPHTPNGFGDTLGRWGMAPGPYLFLPLFGPSNFRDIIGLGVDFYTDPLGWGHYHGDAVVRGSIWIIGGLDQRVEADRDLKQIEQMGTDVYATMRSLYLQNREADIRGNAPVKIEELPQFDDPAATPAPPAPEAPAAAPSANDQAKPSAAVTAAVGTGDAVWFLAPEPEHRPVAGPPIEL